MLSYPFNNFEEFKELFGIIQHGNGVKSRKNRILLSYLKQPGLLKKVRETGDYSLINIHSMAELRQVMLDHIQQSGKEDSKLPYEMQLKNYSFWSDKYCTDGKKGVTLDGDTRAIRYINMESNHDYKMKCGKMFNHLINATTFGRNLPVQVITFLCEELTMEWCSHNALFNGMELHIDEDFERIYNSDYCKGDFHSCMVDKGHDEFYSSHVKGCRAAYLQNEEGMIIARAIIFTAYDEQGKSYQVCERQYSTDCDDVLKRMLVDRLIMEGEIQLFKKVGSGCSEATAFVGINGEDMSHLKLFIELDHFYSYSTCSYMDSFKWVSFHNQRAYNYDTGSWDEMIDITDETIDDYHGENDDDDEFDAYDDWHEYGCDETVEAYHNGRLYHVDADNLDDFQEIDGTYYHLDNCCACEKCGQWMLKSDATYNSDAEAYFCDDKCEAEYIKKNFTYSEYDDDYFWHEDDVTTIQTWDEESQSYKSTTISCLSKEWLINNGRAFGGGELWFITNEALQQTA